MTEIKCKRTCCKHNENYMCKKENITLNAYGKCCSCVNKFILYHTKEINFNKVKKSSVVKQPKKPKNMMVFKRV